MTHLTSEQLVEAAEGILPAERARHLDQCETCRTNVEMLQTVLSDVGDTSTVPEPSPLFWEHFSRRVREATATEGVPRRSVGGGAGCGRSSPWVRSLERWRSPCCCAADRPTAGRRGPAEVVATAGEPAVSDDTVDVVTAAVGDLSFDELRAADLVPSRGAVDLAVSSLNAAQQRELMRLVREELIGSE